MSIATTPRREPNMYAFSVALATPLFLAFIVLMGMIFNDDFQRAGIDAKSTMVLWLVGAAFAVMLLGTGIWSFVYRKWMGFLIPLGALVIGALMIPPLHWLMFEIIHLLI